jgi:hypothetical protein
MVYGLIDDVRTLAGIKPVHQHDVQLKDGDGTTTEFKVPAVGSEQGYFLDLDSGTTSSITIADVVVYDDGVPVTVSAIDNVAGTVTLSVAPAADSVMTIDYKFSEVSDAQVIVAMNIAQEIVDRIIRGKNTASNSYVQTESGDGETNEWEFHHADVTSITSIVVDGTTLTANSHYYLWKYPRTDDYWYVEFVTAPSKNYQNVVITYDHGNVKAEATKLSNHYAARHLINSGQVRGQDSSGLWVEGQGDYDSEADTSRLGMINREIIDIQSRLDERDRYEIS